MSFDTIFRNAQLLSSEGIHEADIAVKNGKIVELGSLAQSSAAEEIDVKGLIVMPGCIDTQVHFREPGLEHKEDLATGSLAALHGGITTFLEMPNTKPETTTPEALEDKIKRATGRSWVNFGFFFGASPSNAEMLGQYENLPGTPGIKVFMGSSTGDLLVASDEDVENVLRHGKRRVAFHSEDEARNTDRKTLISETPSVHEHHYLRDAESARICTERLLRICEKTGRPVHVLHISTADELPMLKAAKAKGLPVTCEVTPQHLWFAAPDAYNRLGTKAQMNPPIRSEEHRAAIWAALQEGLFDVFGSDHAPHTLEEKSKPYPSSPSGMPGVETMLPVLLTFAAQGRISYRTIAKMLCETPAALYTMRGKGQIIPGYDADLVLVDPKQSYVVDESTLHSKCGWSPYHGETFTGRVEAVYVGGMEAMSGGATQGVPHGRVVDFTND
jgi:dihydroorotase